MMSNQVFKQKYVGDYFNQHFVNLKMDMEKGEGKDLQKRYGVSAFPDHVFAGWRWECRV